MRPRFRLSIASVMVAVAAAWFMTACSTNSVSISVRQSAVEPPMTDAYLIVGPAKEYFPKFPKETSTKYSGKQPGEVTILYKFRGESQSWTSPPFDPAVISKVTIDIDTATVPAKSAFRYSVETR